MTLQRLWSLRAHDGCTDDVAECVTRGLVALLDRGLITPFTCRRMVRTQRQTLVLRWAAEVCCPCYEVVPVSPSSVCIEPVLVTDLSRDTQRCALKLQHEMTAKRRRQRSPFAIKRIHLSWLLAALHFLPAQRLLVRGAHKKKMASSRPSKASGLPRTPMIAYRIVRSVLSDFSRRF